MSTNTYTLRSGKTYSRAPRQKKVKMPVKVTKKDILQDRQIHKLQRTVKKIMPEVKYYDYYNSNGISGGFAGTAYSVPTIIQGDDVDDRVGEEIRAKSLDLDLAISHVTTVNGNIPSIVRCIVLWDKQWNGETTFYGLTSQDIPQGYLSDIPITNEFMAPVNRHNSERYVTLYDKRIVLNPTSSTTQASMFLHKHINLRDTIVKFTDSSQSVASLPSRNLIVFLMGNPDQTQVNIGFRFSYTDN